MCTMLPNLLCIRFSNRKKEPDTEPYTPLLNLLKQKGFDLAELQYVICSPFLENREIRFSQLPPSIITMQSSLHISLFFYLWRQHGSLYS